MVRRSLSVAFVVAVAAAPAVIGACGQIQGLDDFEKVACLDDCAADASVTPIDAPAVDAPIEPDAACPPTTTKCGEACVDTTSDPSNCGACGKVCTTGNACCAGACVDTTTDKDHCGACGSKCASTESCKASTCELLLLGNGSDGPLDVATDTSMNAILTGGLVAVAGQRAALVATTVGFAAGDLVLFHQTRGTGAGAFELVTVEKVDAATKTITLVRNLKNTYASDAVARAQAIRVPQHTTVNVQAGKTLTAQAWDGVRGGILVLTATGAVTVAGTIDLSGRGFVGFSHAATCAGGTRYFCNAADTANGFSGESGVGPSAAGNAANGAGGGGGQDGQDCGGGAGGGHGTAGAVGPDGTGLVCRNGPQLGGASGAASGDPNLDVALLFGGAGGEGGADEDGAYPGKGGNGGGIILMRASSFDVTGAIRANGQNGGNGISVDAGCGGAGCGMGPGGGGAGGAIHLVADVSAALGTGFVTATGGVGGACSCTAVASGGQGGAGRIGVTGLTSGSTVPAFVAK